MEPMRFKNYTWPHNPRTYSIRFERVLKSRKIPFGRYQLQNLGLSHRVLTGEGEFCGPGAYEEFKKLATVFYEETPGLLVHPLWQTSQAYFVSLQVQQTPQPDYVRYSFAFWEERSGEAALQEADTASKPGRCHTVAEGETLWHLCREYGLELEELLALNPQIKNPNLIRPGEQVTVV